MLQELCHFSTKKLFRHTHTPVPVWDDLFGSRHAMTEVAPIDLCLLIVPHSAVLNLCICTV